MREGSPGGFRKHLLESLRSDGKKSSRGRGKKRTHQRKHGKGKRAGRVETILRHHVGGKRLLTRAGSNMKMKKGGVVSQVRKRGEPLPIRDWGKIQKEEDRGGKTKVERGDDSVRRSHI